MTPPGVVQCTTVHVGSTGNSIGRKLVLRWQDYKRKHCCYYFPNQVIPQIGWHWHGFNWSEPSSLSLSRSFLSSVPTFFKFPAILEMQVCKQLGIYLLSFVEGDTLYKRAFRKRWESLWTHCMSSGEHKSDGHQSPCALYPMQDAVPQKLLPWTLMCYACQRGTSSQDNLGSENFILVTFWHNFGRTIKLEKSCWHCQCNVGRRRAFESEEGGSKVG